MSLPKVEAGDKLGSWQTLWRSTASDTQLRCVFWLTLIELFCSIPDACAPVTGTSATVWLVPDRVLFEVSEELLVGEQAVAMSKIVTTIEARLNLIFIINSFLVLNCCPRSMEYAKPPCQRQEGSDGHPDLCHCPQSARKPVRLLEPVSSRIRKIAQDIVLSGLHEFVNKLWMIGEHVDSPFSVEPLTMRPECSG